MKRIAAIVLLAITLLLCGCSNHRVRRIRLNGAALGEIYSECIGESTTVRNMSDDSSDFYRLTQLPVYEIIPRQLTPEEFREFAEAFGAAEGVYDTEWDYTYATNGVAAVYMGKSLEYAGYEIRLSCGTDNVPYVPVSDERLEEIAWEVFNRIPFLKGLDYEYVGQVGERAVTSPSGFEFIECVRVKFRRLVDGIPVNGNDMCQMYINGAGVYEVDMYVYDYKKSGMMDVVPYKTALENVREPDGMVIPAEQKHMEGKADTMTVESTKLFYMNQYYDDLEDEGMILQPYYSLKGTLSNSTGSAEFYSLIIAIPDKYTYKEKLYTSDRC